MRQAIYHFMAFKHWAATSVALACCLSAQAETAKADIAEATDSIAAQTSATALKLSLIHI